MITLVKRSETQKIVVTINTPMIENYQACDIQWERSNYSRFNETWDSFSSMDYELSAYHINNETIILNVRFATLFICPVCIEGFAAISSTGSLSI